MRNGNHRIVFRQLLVLNPTLLHRRKDHRRFWEQPLAIALDKGGCGRADGDNEMNRTTNVKSAKIFYKCSFRWPIIVSGIHQRVVEKVHLTGPLLIYLRADGLRVVAPRFETGAKRMQYHHPLGLWISGLTLTQRGQQ